MRAFLYAEIVSGLIVILGPRRWIQFQWTALVVVGLDVIERSILGTQSP